MYLTEENSLQRASPSLRLMSLQGGRGAWRGDRRNNGLVYISKHCHSVHPIRRGDLKETGLCCAGTHRLISFPILALDWEVLLQTATTCLAFCILLTGEGRDYWWRDGGGLAAPRGCRR